MSIIVTLLLFAATSEAKLFLIEVKEETSTDDSVLNSMNKGNVILSKRIYQDLRIQKIFRKKDYPRKALYHY